MTMPQVFVEIAWVKDAEGSLLWWDVSDDVDWWQGVRITRRRSHELDEVQPGTLSLVLTNTDGRYTAGRATSPHYPNVRINRPIRVRARWPASINRLQAEQATGASTAVFSASSGTLSVDGGVVPAGQSSSIRWNATLSNGSLLRVGASLTSSPGPDALGVTPGATYALQAQARRGASASATVALRVRWYDYDGDQLSDVTGAATALSTTFQTLTATFTAPPDAAWARVVLVSTTASGGVVDVYTSAWQFEQAATPSAWAAPGKEYIRYSGFTDRWPHGWAGGVLGQVALTATDQMKLLERQRATGQALISETLETSPRFYYPMAEAEGATAAGNQAITSQPDLTFRQIGIGGSTVFGVSRGPLGSSIASYTPVDQSNGKVLATDALTGPFNIGGPTAITVSLWCRIADSPGGDGMMSMFYLDDGIGPYHMRLGYWHGTHYFDWGVQTPAGGNGEVSDVNLEDGELHHLVMIGDCSTGTVRAKIYLDAVEVVNVLTPVAATAWPAVMRRLSVGGAAWNSAFGVDTFAGEIGQVAGWTRALTTTEISALYAAGSVASEMSGTRVQRLLDWAGMPVSAVDPGLSPLDISAYESTQSALADLRQAAFSEAGVFFISRDGTPTFHDRSRRQRSDQATVITLTASDCGPDLAFVVDDALLLNDVTIRRGGAIATRVIDQDSIDSYGRYARPVETVLASDADAIDRGRYTLGRYAEPSPRAGQVSVEARSLATRWPDLLDSEIGHRLTITDLPPSAPSSSLNLWVEGVQDVITDQSWHVTFDTSPDTRASLILNDPVYGLLDSNYLGW